jgi:S-DNA-T family DNA segregation ATPase FtsK/SpoIIIE
VRGNHNAPSNACAVAKTTFMKRTKAARSRRVDPLPGLTLNFEILGVAVFVVAALLALSLALGPGAGAFGVLADRTLHVWFGGAAWLAVVALAVIASIIFLELHVPKLMAAFAGCAAGAFFAFAGLFGMAGAGGGVGNAIAHGLTALFGTIGADVVLFFVVLACVVTPTGISLKRAFGALGTSVAAGAAQAHEKWLQAQEERAQRARALLPFAPSAPPIADAIEVTAQPEIEPPPTPTPEAEDQSTLNDVSPNVPAIIEASPLPIDAVVAESTQARAKQARPAGRTEGGYRLPDFALFNPPEKRVHSEASAAMLLEETLASFGVAGKVTHIERGPSVTRYELTPGRGVKVSAIKSLSDNIQLALAAQSVRIEAPIPGKAAVGIEVPNSAVATVAIREILDHVPKGEGTLCFGLGKDITGRPIVADLTRMPHLLVAGATGAGKSVCLNVIIATLLATCTPDQVQMLLIDPKRVELAEYNGIPHLISDCITDPKLAAGALYELTKEMDARYERFARAGVRKIEEYNLEHPYERLPYIVVAIDELADLMLVAPTRVETSICRIAQLARATGIHLVIATQRPSVDVITGLIKANIPSRIAFAVSSQVDSRTILDMAGAERLLGRGDMLFLPIDAPKPIRVQGALVTGPEIVRLCAFWREQGDPDNRLAIEPEELEDDEGGPADDLAFDAARVIVERQMASVALLQAELKIGHPRAVRLMKILEQFRVVGPTEGTKPRKILVGDADMAHLATILAPRRSEQTLL